MANRSETMAGERQTCENNAPGIPHSMDIQGSGNVIFSGVNNSTIYVRQDSSGPQSHICPKHAKSKDLYFFCDACQVLVCGCELQNHQGADHPLSDVSDSAKQRRQQMQELLLEFEDRRGQLESVDSSIKRSKCGLLPMVEQTLRDILAKEKEEIDKIKKMSQSLREKVKINAEEQDKRYNECLRMNSDKIKHVQLLFGTVEDSIKRHDDLDLLDMKQMNIADYYHTNSQSETVHHGQLFTGCRLNDVVKDADLGEILTEKWTEFCREEDGGKGKITYISCFSNGDIVAIDTANKSLSTFTSAGERKSTGVQSVDAAGKLVAPWDVTVTSDDRLLAIDGKNVKMYDNNLQYIRQFSPSQVAANSTSKMNSIDVDNNNLIAIADGLRHVITLHKDDGSMISTISNKLVCGPVRLAINNKGRLIFTNYKEKKLVCVDLNGHEVFNISPTIDKRNVNPAGVCCDDVGNIYVSVHPGDLGAGEIHHYNTEGVRIGCVAHGLYNPIGLTITPAGALVVADRHSVKIFHRE